MTASRWRYVAFAAALGTGWLLLLCWAAALGPRMPLAPAHTHSLPGSRYHAAFGRATADAQQLRVESADDDYAALQVTSLPELDAADYPILSYEFADFPRTLELSLVFRTREAPEDAQTISLPVPSGGRMTFDLSQVDAWRGRIIELGFAQFPVAQLVPPEEGFRPFVLRGARLESNSWRGRIAAAWSSWFTHSPWQLISVSAIGPGGTGDATPHVPRLPLVLALALGLFGALARLLLRLRGAHLMRCMLVTAALAWIALDLVWLRELDYRRAVDRDIWGAVPYALRQDHVAESNMVAAAYRLRNLLANAPRTTRVLVNAESPHDVLRLIYLMAPLNTSGLGAFLVSSPGRVAEGTVLVNYGVDRPRPIGGVMRIGPGRVRVRVLDRNQDLTVYRVEAVIR
ncbi:hypothetical protein [Dokdonella sp.]|uniref:hypothetical protein n=1 Tax=Dokdonella sp. TaxID=2291710 RepID=UPI0037843437